MSDREPDVEFSAVTKYHEHLKVLLDIKHHLESKILTTKDKIDLVMCNAPKNITEQADNQPEDIHATTRKEETNPMEENLTARSRKLKEKNGNLLEVFQKQQETIIRLKQDIKHLTEENGRLAEERKVLTEEKEIYTSFI